MKKYKANFHYFDSIDTPNKAYWLGFIWADGYIAKRDRGNRLEYNLKLAIDSSDASHVQKFVDDLDSNYPVHLYQTEGFGRTSTEARAFITNMYMCSYLYEDLGIKPRRTNPDAVISVIPKDLYRYFILGLFDADGSFSSYKGDYGSKLNVTFGGSEQLLKFIERYLIDHHLIADVERKFYHRHEDGDGTWRTLGFAGIPQGMRILNYLYKDSVIHLDRKYEKYLELPYHNR